MNRILFVFFFSVFLSSGCISTTVGLVPSTKPLAPNGYEELGPVRENDCGIKLFGVFPISSGNNLQQAVNDAIADRDGADALIQVSIEEFTDFWVLFSRECVHVEGIAVKSHVP